MLSLQVLILYLSRSQTTAEGNVKLVTEVDEVNLYNSACLLFCVSAKLGINSERRTGNAIVYIPNTIKNIVV